VQFIRRYWWAYPLFLLLKWGSIGVLGYIALADPKEEKLESSAKQVLNISAGSAMPPVNLPAWLPGAPQVQNFDVASLKGQRAYALFFYPMDDTPGCTREACALRDSHAELSAQGLTVIGVSADSHASHAAFAEKYGLPFALLVDEEGALRAQLGSPDGSEQIYARMTYIVDREGIVRAVIGGEGITVEDHVAGIRDWAAKLAVEEKSAS